MAEPPKKMSRQDCLEKAAECRDLATRARTESDRTMLLHMADTWERLAESTSTNGSGR